MVCPQMRQISGEQTRHLQDSSKEFNLFGVKNTNHAKLIVSLQQFARVTMPNRAAADSQRKSAFFVHCDGEELFLFSPAAYRTVLFGTVIPYPLPIATSSPVVALAIPRSIDIDSPVQ